jgi:hypothetical protein
VSSEIIEDRWNRRHHQSSLDVPTYLRKQMD